MEFQCIQNNHSNFEKDFGGFNLAKVKAYQYKAALTRTVWYTRKVNNRDGAEIDSWYISNRFYIGAKVMQWGYFKEDI